MEKLYDRIDWNNNTSPALNETNLNLMSKGLDDIDDRVVEIAGDILVVIPQIQQYLSDADAIIERLQELTENPPYIGQNGNWYVWDTNTGAYVDSGVDASITVSIADITMIGVNENPRVTNTGTNTDPVFHLFIPAANGIARIAKTGTSGLTDTYTVTFDNGNTTTFTVVNGRGITKIEKTGTEDLVDTYTITYNDNSTSTFTVTNGKDGRNTDQVSTMPEASEDELGNIYQFTGTTTANFTHGYYYECKYDSEDDLYFWDNINVGELAVAGQDVSDAVETTITTSTATYPEFSAGETLKVIFGKIKKFLSDLKGNKADLTNLATVESTTTASKSYSVDDWLILNGQLCKVTAAISSGGTITIGTNVEPTTVEDGKSSSSGHTIKDYEGLSYPQRTYLQFEGATVTDDSENNTTHISLGGTKIVTWAQGTYEEIAAMLEAHYRGDIDIHDYWSVGDERTVNLSAMAATGVSESHAAQTITVVLTQAGGKTLSDGVTECAFQWDQKYALSEPGYMNSTKTNTGGWGSTARRTWCNNVFLNALPLGFKSICKQFKNITANSAATGNSETLDYISLRGLSELYISSGMDAVYVNIINKEGLTRIPYYATTANLDKIPGSVSGDAQFVWLRTPLSNDGNNSFCCITQQTNFIPSYLGGNGSTRLASLAVFGCI